MDDKSQLEKNIGGGFKRHGKKVAGDVGKIGKELGKAGSEVGKSFFKVGEATLDAGISVSKAAYNVGKATLETGMEVTKTAVAISTFPYRKRRSIKDYFWKAKRGVITGAADNDPAGIATYSQVGASTGFSLLWLAVVTTPLLITIEEMSSRVGVVARKGLNSVIKEKFGFGWAIFAAIILIICNIATLGADLAGMSAVLGMVFNVNWQWFLLPLTFAIIYLLVVGKYSTISRFLFLVTPFLLLYVLTAFIVKPDWFAVLKNTFVPMFSNWSINYLAAAIAVLGTTISAYLIFWETSQEIEEHKTVDDLKKESNGVTMGMIFCNLIFYFIIVAAGATLFKEGINNIETANQAALALKPLAGDFAFLLFTIGIFASGLIAVPVLAASASYVVSDAFDWVGGLNRKPHKAREFYLVMALALLVGSAMGLLGLNPMKMLFYSQVLQGVLTPILLVFLILICNDKKIMGTHTNHFWSNFFGWLTVLIMGGLSIVMIYQFLK